MKFNKSLQSTIKSVWSNDNLLSSTIKLLQSTIYSYYSYYCTIYYTLYTLLLFIYLLWS